MCRLEYQLLTQPTYKHTESNAHVLLNIEKKNTNQPNTNTVEPPYNVTPRSGQTLNNGQTVGNGVFSACM